VSSQLGRGDADGAPIGRGGGRLRRVAAHLLATLGVLLVAASAALGQIRRGLFDSDAFADRLAASLTDRRVSAYVAHEITRAILREKPDLVAVRPIILATAQSAVATDAFRGLVRVTARQAHATVLSKGGRNVLLSIPDAGVVLRGALTNASPTLAARIPGRISAAIATLGDSGASRFIVDVWQIGRKLAWAARAGTIAGLALLIAGIALAPRRAQALRRASIDVALAGLALLLLIPAGRAIVRVAPAGPLAQQAAAGLFDAFTRGLRGLALGLGAVGIALSAAAHSLTGRAWLPDRARSAWMWLTRPPLSTAQRLTRGALLLGGGVCLIVRPAATLSALAVAVGVVLSFAGLQALFRLGLRALPDEVAVERGAAERLTDRRSFLLLALAGVLAAATAWVTRPREPSIVRLGAGCNGDQRLCERRLDEVVFAGTHNSMSAVDRRGWMFAQQERGVATQLDDGVRAFLIDVFAGIPVAGRVKTELGSGPGFMREVENAVGKEGLEAAFRIRERLVGPPEGPRALYLCHGFCELGSQSLVPWLRTMRDFLTAHPRDVVILVIEDYVRPDELAAAFADSGLAALVFRGAPRPPWPTLDEMAASGQRVVTFLESGKTGVDWMYPAFASIQETPYRASAPAQLSCRVNRGATTGSLFQINHWIETPPTPRPSNAAIINRYDFLLERAEACTQERAHLPNIIAVDFYRTGDLFQVVKHLNGLDLPQAD